MPPGDLAPVIATCVFFVAFASVLILRGPLGKALARRIEGTAASGDLERRVAGLERQAERVHELEERLDFAERLLAQERAESARLQSGDRGGA